MSDIGTLRQISTDPFSFDWEIDDYFNRSQKAYTHIESPLFTFGEAIWHLKLFPNGLSKIGFVELFLKKIQSFEEVHDISCMVGVKNKRGDLYTFEFVSCNIKGCCPIYGIDIIERSTLRSFKWSLVPNNRLTISVKDFVLNNKPNVDLYCKPQILQAEKIISTGIEILFQNLKDLLLNEEGCDVTLKVKGIEIRAHRCVLIAQSRVFASMFSHQTSETITGIVEVPDCTPDTFKVLLLYLYSGTAENLSTSVVYDLYETAVKYDLELLKMECVQFMKDEISPDTLYDTLALSKKHKESELFEHATNYFNEHVLDILITIKWQEYLKEDPVTANELYIKAFQKTFFKFFNSENNRT